MAYERFRPMTPSSFKFAVYVSGLDTDFVNKFQPIWTPYTPLAVLPTPFGLFTNYEQTTYTAGCDAPKCGASGDSYIGQEVPSGEFNEWVGKGPFNNLYSSGSMAFNFTNGNYTSEGEVPGYPVYVEITTYECSNNHRPWIGQFVTMTINVTRNTWTDGEITDTSDRDIVYTHECTSSDFSTSPVWDPPDTPYGYIAGSRSFSQLIEDIDFLEDTLEDGNGVQEQFTLGAALGIKPLEFSRTDYFPTFD